MILHIALYLVYN